MSANTFVLKPSFSDDLQNHDPIALIASVPFCFVTDEKLNSYLGPHPYPERFQDGSLVFERIVSVMDLSDLNAKSWAFAAELQLAFGTSTPHVY